LAKKWGKELDSGMCLSSKIKRKLTGRAKFALQTGLDVANKTVHANAIE